MPRKCSQFAAQFVRIVVDQIRMSRKEVFRLNTGQSEKAANVSLRQSTAAVSFDRKSFQRGAIEFLACGFHLAGDFVRNIQRESRRASDIKGSIGAPSIYEKQWPRIIP